MGHQSMTRRPGWEDAYAVFVQARADMAFGWGVNDDVSCCADLVEALTGARSLEMPWVDEAGAVAFRADAGALAAHVTAALGEPSLKNKYFIRRGDVALVDDDERGPILAFCVGDRLVTPSPTRAGFDEYRLGDVVTFWRV